MPKVITEDSLYMLRISYKGNNEKSFKELSSFMKEDQRFSSCLGVWHSGKNGNNKHHHYVICAKLSQPTLRDIIKKYFVPKSYSCKKVTKHDDELYSYLFHERDDCITFNKNISDQDIQKYQKLNAEIQSDYQDGGSKYKLVNDIITQYKALLDDKKQLNKMRVGSVIDEQTRHVAKFWPRHKMLAWLIYKYYDEGWFPSKFQMERYILTIERQLNKNEGTEYEGFEELYRNYFLN